MKFRILSLLLALSLLAGCAAPIGTDTVTESPIGTGDDLYYTFYLPDQAPYYFTEEIEAGDMAYLEELIVTNTTKIKVKNSGDITLQCDLYYPEDSSNVIQTFTLKPGKTIAFSHLTSAMVYCIAFYAEESGTVDVKIIG